MNRFFIKSKLLKKMSTTKQGIQIISKATVMHNNKN